MARAKPCSKRSTEYVFQNPVPRSAEDSGHYNTSWFENRCSPEAFEALISCYAPAISGVHDSFESAVHHSFHVEWHCLRTYHLRQTRIFHHPGIDAIAVGARLEHDIREQYVSRGLVLIPRGNGFPILMFRLSPTHSRNSSAP